MRKLIGCALLCACASQGMPPGGPPDSQAPVILAITPDSGKTLVKDRSAVFEFDEVVNERPPAVTTLGDLFVVSPRQGAPTVSWHRRSIEVKPRKGWLPNTTYSVTMLPGLSDLRGNVKNTGATTFFSTGPTVDRGIISGFVADLFSGSTPSGTVVEAKSDADTTISWTARTDSTGAFRLAHLPARTFLIRAYVDKNKNFAVDPDEAVDTATVSLRDSASADFFLAVRDSVAPRLLSATVTDSATITVAFDRPVDSAAAATVANYSLAGNDSSIVPILSVRPVARDTSLKRFHTARALPLPAVTLVIAHPLSEKVQYHLRTPGLKGLIGQAKPSEVLVTRGSTPGPVTRPAPPPNLPTGAVPLPIKHE